MVVDTPLLAVKFQQPKVKVHSPIQRSTSRANPFISSHAGKPIHF